MPGYTKKGALRSNVNEVLGSANKAQRHSRTRTSSTRWNGGKNNSGIQKKRDSVADLRGIGVPVARGYSASDTGYWDDEGKERAALRKGRRDSDNEAIL